MLNVIKDGKSFPFSRGILARSIAPTGLPIEIVYSIIDSIRDELEAEDRTEIESKELRDIVCRKLRERGYETVEKYYRVSRGIAHLTKPVLILIGGAAGVGKSVIGAELANRFGVERIIGTDTIREIMRYMIPYDLIPLLHESSYKVEETLQNPLVENKLIYGFGRQASLVCEGVRAFLRRNAKEGLNAIVNGIHLVPGHLKQEVNDEEIHLFHYVLTVKDKAEHVRRFQERAQYSRRDARRYIDELQDIREIQDYISRMAEKQDVMVIDNTSMEETIGTIMEDITMKLEEEV